MKQHYDVVVAGSGLGGLVSAIILAKEGYKVCVLEKNNQYGGNLQTFVREKTIFDTGVHYIGGLSKGQNLYEYFKYIGIIDDLELKKLDEDGFDIISFDNDNKSYKHAQGYDNFKKQLLNDFPEEKEAISLYCKALQDTCNKFPLYSLQSGVPIYEDTKLFETSASEFINSLTANKKLQAVLAGTNYLYAGEAYATPFYVHALSVNSYIESAYRCIKGGSQITKALIKQLKLHNGEAYKKSEVVKFNVVDKKVTSLELSNGTEIFADLFISNIDPKVTLEKVGKDAFRKSYVNRISNIKSTTSAFSLHIVLKPNSIKYHNKNYYHFKDYNDIWITNNYTDESWPEGYMVSMGLKEADCEFADNITVMTYMRYDEVKPWEHTFNTVVHKNDRGETYEEFKTRKTEQLITELEKKYPNIRASIQSTYTSTPLSFRDYIGCNKGSMYGYVKDVDKPMQSHLSARTKLSNLYLTGQCLSMHGILGVTISAIITCSEIVGKEYLINKILNKINN
ncbi:NAD(P)/FAD-dependent oxidoreductase [Seonamhaeicola marinus]|uniref:NAD(P)/FAD-dependent oxidoreductase n=1 Tax=Seonamhaeicola marinus TaxID=1912246 RepID=A0A5D0HWW7_9FLAO|nr:NAD(P)/FAD-dependent oxidoreductase [Seonamhaeicola marinus]TYA75019.1 NAD(P)/FAD-dependent oxidoreductase [Seonamhaeicola marinus]